MPNEQDFNNLPDSTETNNNPSQESNNLEKTVFLPRTLIYLTVGAIAIVAIFVAWRFFQVGDGNGKEVILWFDMPDTVTIGSETEFTIVYENHESNTIKDISLELTYPGGFEFVSGTPASRDATGRQFNLPQLSSGASGNVKLSGIFTGTPASSQSVRARLLYTLEGVSSQFSAESTTSLQLQAANFDLRLSGPTDHINGQRIEYNIVFQNISDAAQDLLFVKLHPPQGFSYETDVAASEEVGVYEVGRLSPGEEYELNVFGNLSGNEGDRKIMRADLISMGPGGEEIVQGRAVLTTVIAKAALTVSHKLTKNELNLNPGEELEYEITYLNQGDRGLRNAIVTLEFENSIFDLSTLRAEGGALVGGSVIWNVSGVPGLEVLSPGSGGTLTLNVKLRSDIVARNISNPTGSTRVFIRSQEFPNNIPGNEETIKIKTVLAPSATLFHLSGPQVPTSNETTEYRLLLSLANTVNRTEDIVWLGFVSTPNVEIVEGSEEPQNLASELSFDYTSGRVIWSLGALDPFTDSSVSFVIRVTPSIADKGRSLQVFRSTEVTGKDIFINRTITIGNPPNLQTPTVK